MKQNKVKNLQLCNQKKDSGAFQIYKNYKMCVRSLAYLLCDLAKYKRISIAQHSICHYFHQMLLLGPST